MAKSLADEKLRDGRISGQAGRQEEAHFQKNIANKMNQLAGWHAKRTIFLEKEKQILKDSEKNPGKKALQAKD